MILNGNVAPKELRTTICIVGSGPAGMTTALELERLGIDCMLLESGGRTLSEEHTSLNQTLQVGITTDPSTANRARVLGGTSTYWGGMCRPLDAIDLEQRPWVAGSGWPITLNELLPHYDTAHRILELPPAQYNLEQLQLLGIDEPHLFTDRDFENIAFYYDKSPVRFGTRYAAQLESSKRIKTFLNATVTNVETDDTGQRVTALDASTIEGNTFRVLAEHFILAAGAIQTARLLLNANSVHKTGLGNTYDMVGRNFLQHPVLYGPRLLTFDAQARRRLRRAGKKDVAIRSAIRADAARQYHLLNFHFFLMQQDPPGKRERVLRSLPLPLRNLLQNTPYSRVGEVGHVPEYLQDLHLQLTPEQKSQTHYTQLEIRAEQAPNADSRITLGTELDQLGMRRAVMDWRLTELDKSSMRDGMKLLGGSMARNRIGRVQAAAEQLQTPEVGGAFLHGGHHQYGTTRMGDSPKSSVVDGNCRVHGLANLYVAGSAVFPTTGHANPTLTIVALAARLAKYMVDTVSR